MGLNYDEHYAAIKADGDLAEARLDREAARFMQAADKAADIVLKTEVTRTANLATKIDALKNEREDFLS